MNSRALYIYFLGSSGFPYGYANIERQKLISKGLVNAGAQVTVISRKGVHIEKEYPNLKDRGIHEGVKFIYLSGSPYRPNGLIIRNLLKIRSLFREIKFLIIEKRKSQLSAIVFNARNFSSLVYYYILSKLLHVPMAFNYVELNSSMENRTSMRHKLNDYLFENIGLRMIPIILPISNYLMDFSKKKNNRAKYLKIPSLCNFEIFDLNQIKLNENYILFCGSATYIETITFVIESYVLSNIANTQLYLIINGSISEMKTVEDAITSSGKRKNIKVFSKLSYNMLVTYYKSAKALLIPIRPNKRDIARFPHKIGEYTASCKPIISNNIGEVSQYFEDNNNAFIASEFNSLFFAEKIKYAISNSNVSTSIGKNGYMTGIKHFDYKANGKRLYKFLLNEIY
jgi:glycosyltransferase involved in cell wall biosynthesis